jgi:hypothetical protein
MGVFDFLRAAIAPAAAARTGYVEGQELETDRKRTQAIQDAALKRQSVLDQLKASVDKSNIDRNNALADRYNRTPATQQRPSTIDTDQGIMQWDPETQSYKATGFKAPTKTTGSDTPHTINTDQGIMQWDPITKTYKPTGFKSPPKKGTGAGSSAQDRLDAKTALDEAEKDTPRPSKTPAEITNPDVLNAKPGTDVKKLPIRIPNPARAKVEADSIAYDDSTLKPLRQHLIDVTVGDKVKLGGAPSAGASNASRASTSTPLSSDDMTAMQSEFDEASANLNAVLNSAAPKAVKDQARALYNQQQTSIAKKYGATGQP